jgi:hypothetical protein
MRYLLSVIDSASSFVDAELADAPSDSETAEPGATRLAASSAHSPVLASYGVPANGPSD